MLLTLKNAEILSIGNALNNLPKEGSTKFKLAAIRLLKVIETDFNALNKLRAPSEEFVKYQNDLRDLAKKYCEVENDQVVLYTDSTYATRADVAGVVNGVPRPINEEAAKEMDKAFIQFKADNQEVIDRNNKAADEFNKLLEDTVDIEINKLGMNDLETVGNLDYQTLIGLYPVIDHNR